MLSDVHDMAQAWLSNHASSDPGYLVTKMGEIALE
jgi:hypothetical protein